LPLAAGRAWRQYDCVSVTPTVQLAYTLEGSTIFTDGQGVADTYRCLGTNIHAHQNQHNPGTMTLSVTATGSGNATHLGRVAYSYTSSIS
jgi:hypothetical protein